VTYTDSVEMDAGHWSTENETRNIVTILSILHRY